MKGHIIGGVGTPVRITGSASVGAVVTASLSAGSTASSYQWKRDGVAISGATAASYTLVLADVGHVITCEATGMSFNSLGRAIAPAAPVLTLDTVTTNSITGSFTEPVGADSYEIFLDGEVVGTSVVPSFELNGLLSKRHYSIAVKALAGTVRSGLSNVLSVETQAVGLLKKFYYVPSHGQSLSIGDRGLPVAHTTVTWPNKVSMYNNVPPIGPGFEVDVTSSDVASLVDFKEVSKETGAWAMFNYLDQESALDDRWMYVSTGVGGKTIEDLTDVGAGHQWGWGNIVAAWNALAAVIPGGYTVRIPFSIFIHGEAQDLTYWLWKPRVRVYHDNYKELTGQDFPLLISQTGKNASLDIANEILEYALENNDAEFVVAQWFLNRAFNGDSEHLHLSPAGYQLQREYFARAAIAKMNGEEVPNVYPESWVVSADKMSLDVTFHVPVGANLVIDTVTFPAAPGLGMGFKPLPSFAHTPATSYVQNGNVISFLFPQPITTDAQINFGNTLSDAANYDNILLPCNNVRDDSPDKSPTQGVNMYNWCPQRKLVVTTANGALDRAVGNLWIYGSFDGSLAAFEIGLGKSTDLLLTDIATCQLDFDCVVISGSARMFVGDTSRTLTTGHHSLVVTIGTAKRMMLQGLTGGFTGSVSNVVVITLS